MRLLTTAALTCLLATVIITAQGQQPPANPTNKTGVIGLMHAIHSTNDVDKTLAFYQAVFGTGGQVRPFASTGPQILTDSPGATLRVAMTQLKGGFNFELTEFGNVERQLNKQPEIADPGAPMIKIIVRDIDAIVAAAKNVNAPIVTKGGAAGHGAHVDRQREGDRHARPRRLLRSGDSGNARGRLAGRRGHRRHPGTHRRRASTTR